MVKPLLKWSNSTIIFFKWLEISTHQLAIHFPPFVCSSWRPWGSADRWQLRLHCGGCLPIHQGEQHWQGRFAHLPHVLVYQKEQKHTLEAWTPTQETYFNHSFVSMETWISYTIWWRAVKRGLKSQLCMALISCRVSDVRSCWPILPETTWEAGPQAVCNRKELILQEFFQRPCVAKASSWTMATWLLAIFHGQKMWRQPGIFEMFVGSKLQDGCRRTASTWRRWSSLGRLCRSSVDCWDDHVKKIDV